MPSSQTSPIVSKRRLGLAGAAAFIGCAACCAMPLVAAAGLGSGGTAILSSVLRPGSELIVGGGVFAIALAAMALWSRFKRGESSGCGTACKVDGTCCDRGAMQRSA
jgi:mercuric ion transport protein